MTLLLSYLIFTKPLTVQHVGGLLLLSMGIGMKLLPDNKCPKRTTPSSEIPKSENPVNYGEENRFRSGIEEEEEEERPLI